MHVITIMACARKIVFLVALGMLLSVMSVGNTEAATRSFSKRFSTNANGDIVIIGNSLMTCNELLGNGPLHCADARNRLGGIGFDVNNNYTMRNVNDADPSRTNAASATLSIPAGATVLWAGLYWAGESNSAARAQALFGTPGSFGYTTVNATQVDFDATATARYSSFQDVTSLVQAAGSGTYTMANVQTFSGGSNHFGGWALVVVFNDNTLPLRNLAVFDGFQIVTPAVTIGLSGFLTPLSGAVNAKLGIVALEGDMGHNDTYGRDALTGLTGDYFQFNGIADANTLYEGVGFRKPNDFYTSLITDNGAYNDNRFPSYHNNFGFDIVSRLQAPNGLIANGATSATIRSNSAGETFYPVLISSSIDLYVPIVTPNMTKTVAKVNGGGPIIPGDTLRFTISMSNTGLDAATNLVLSDNIPAYTTYVPNSMRVISGANAGAKSDASGDDQAEYFASGTPRVAFRLGNGANSSQGGVLPYLSATSLSFDVTLNTNTPAGTTINNAAQISYNGQTITTQTFTGASAAASVVVTGPPLITKSFSPNPVAVNAPSTMTLVVSNPAGNTGVLTGVAFTDSYPGGMINNTPASPVLVCTGGSSATLSGGGDGAASVGISAGTLAVGGSCTLTVSVKSATQGSYTNTTGAVSSIEGGNGTAASAILSVGKPAVSLKAFSPASILSGGTSQLQLTLTNPSFLAISNVSFSDVLTGMTVASPLTYTNTCGGGVTDISGTPIAAGSSSIKLNGGTMTSGGTCTLLVNVTGAAAGVFPNQTSGVTSTETGTAGLPSNSANLTVVGPPLATKVFSPPSISINTLSLLTISLTNPNTTTTLTGVAFTDTYPTNLINAAIPNATISCSSGSSATLVGGSGVGPGNTTIGISAGTLLPGGSCTVRVNVTSATQLAPYTDNADPVTTTTTVNGSAVSGSVPAADISVFTLTPPAPTLLFNGAATATISAGVSATMTIRLTNPATAGTRSGITYTNTYPPGLVNAAVPGETTTCGGVVTASPGGNSITLSGASLNGSAATCTVTVAVTSMAAGSYNNYIPIGAIATSNAGVSIADASATLTVNGGPIVAKYFTPSTIVPGGTSTIKIVISNPNNAVMNTVAFTDSYLPSTFTNTGPAATIACTAGSTAGTLTSTATSISSTTTSSIAANGSCTITGTVTSPTAGSHTNTINAGAVTSAIGANILPASATLIVASGPTTSKFFSPNPVLPGQPSTLTITLSNPFSNDMTVVGLTDSYPAGIKNSTPSNAQVTCTAGGSASIAAGTGLADGTNVGISGGTIKSAGSCSITTSVVATAAGDYSNSNYPATSASHGNAPSGSPSILTVMAAPTALSSFVPAMTGAGETSVLTITLTNPNTSASVSGIAFSDTYPGAGALVNAPVPAASTTCAGGTVTAVAGTNILVLSGGTIPNGGSCTVTVTVTSAIANVYTNSTGVISTTNAGNGIAATAILTVLQKPAVVKAFTPASIPVTGSSVMTLTITNPNGAQALSAVAISDTFPAGLSVVNPPAASTTCGGTLTGTADGSTTVSLAGGAVVAGGNCTITISVKASAGGSYDNTTSGVTAVETVGAGLASNTATLTVTTGSVLGTVYNDANHNGGQNVSESGSGLPATWVKLANRSGAACSAPALSATAVDAVSGAYSVSGIAPGDYCLIVASNAILADVAATPAPGWLVIEGAAGIRLVTVGAGALSNQNFGVYNGSRVIGRVFADTGAGGGTANNGIQDVAEAGLAGVPVKVTDNGGGITFDATVTNGSGDFILWVPASAGAAQIKVVETNPSSSVSTGGSAGTSGGSYDRASDTNTFSNTLGSSYTGLTFADVPDNRFQTDNIVSALPGTVLFHPHSFTAGSGGTVVFSSSAVASPVVPGWSEVFYRDSNCSGSFDSGEPQITAAITLLAGEQLCMLTKEFVPANAPIGASNLVTTTATFTYTNASPGLLRTTTRSDNTTVGAPSGAGLTLTKTVDNATALPGSNLTYTITYGNSSSGPLNNIAIHDSVPAFTALNATPPNPCCVNPSSACLGSALTPFPNNITACTASTSGDSITWTLSGTLAPGASGQVRFRVTVQP